jgi:hypothetical protein
MECLGEKFLLMKILSHFMRPRKTGAVGPLPICSCWVCSWRERGVAFSVLEMATVDLPTSGHEHMCGIAKVRFQLCIQNYALT